MTGIRKSVRYQTRVDSLEEAWVMVMATVDRVKDPAIQIHPVWVGDVDGPPSWDVSVSGDEEETE